MTRPPLDSVRPDIGNFIEPVGTVLHEQPRELTFRFAKSLPDGSSRIRINGSGVGGTALENTGGDAFNGGVDLTL